RVTLQCYPPRLFLLLKSRQRRGGRAVFLGFFLAKDGELCYVESFVRKESSRNPPMRKRSLLLAVLLVGLCPLTTRAEDPKVGFMDRIHKDADGKEAKYVLFVPHDYKGDKEYPVILFL